MTYSDGSVFEGSFKNNERWIGRMTLANGLTYMGHFINSLDHNHADDNKLGGSIMNGRL